MEDFTNVRVLVVEDNGFSLTVALKVLHLLGIKPKTAENGRQALALAESTQFDLILMDCKMPELDGYQTTVRLRAEYPLARNARIIALTGTTRESDLQRCYEAGMDHVIGKPTDIGALIAELSTHLRDLQKRKN